MSEIVVRSGERRRIIHRFSSSLVQTFTIEAVPLTGPGPVSGVVEVRGSRWLFRTAPLLIELTSSTTVHKGFWDTLFSVFVTPDQDVTVTVRRPRLS